MTMTALPPGSPDPSGSASAITYESWRSYDAYVRGALVDEIAAREGFSVKQVHADIADMRDRMRDRYPGISDAEADELRMIYLLCEDARGMIGEPSALKIIAELRLRQRDITQTASMRAQAQYDRQKEHYR